MGPLMTGELEVQMRPKRAEMIDRWGRTSLDHRRVVQRNKLTCSVELTFTPCRSV